MLGGPVGQAASLGVLDADVLASPAGGADLDGSYAEGDLSPELPPT